MMHGVRRSHRQWRRSKSLLLTAKRRGIDNDPAGSQRREAKFAADFIVSLLCPGESQQPAKSVAIVAAHLRVAQIITNSMTNREFYRAKRAPGGELSRIHKL
jgi:hypothetical protein